MINCLYCSFILCAALWRCISWTSMDTWWSHCFIQHVQIFDFIFITDLRLYLSCNTFLFRTDRSFVWHWVVGLKNLSNYLSSIDLPHLNIITYNFNSLIFFENYHGPFYFDWLFEVWNDSGFVQKLPWGLRFFDMDIGVKMLCQYQWVVRPIWWTHHKKFVLRTSTMERFFQLWH